MDSWRESRRSYEIKGTWKQIVSSKSIQASAKDVSQSDLTPSRHYR